MANTKMSSSFTLSLVLLFIISLNSLLTSAIMSDKFASNIDEPSSLRLVYTIERPSNEEPEAFYIQILTPVLGSEEAAKRALVYTFKNSMTGFAANLTPDQVNQILAQPGVLHVAQRVNYDLTGGKKNNNV
ncbi:unnamed protein product [Citrullus colocynthis]|uniref:Inhibitor I9 domain-containing protein n=1 Tax=Citrullus colocynthis TaxID=252529 RepID=A0ABP0XQ17_9ROSI